MKPKYLFTLNYWAPHKEKEKVRIEEHIIAETVQQAIAYWQRELIDEAHEFISISNQVPVIAICPAGIEDRYGKPPEVSA